MGDAGRSENFEVAPVDYDVIIVGAGISGINAAYRMQEQCPHRSYTVLESRSNLGGTWDLFKYPGIRSDSDLHTFGFQWYPWTYEKTIAEGGLIVDYMHKATEKYGLDSKIKYRHKLHDANWSTSSQAWSLRVDADGQPQTLTCRFLMLCTGYYDYHNPLPAQIPGIEKFEGLKIHPQFWPEDLDYTGKNIVIVGSGATAITLLPNLAEKAAHVTMLQRSPSYILSLPRVDASSEFLKKILPASWAAKLTRWKYILFPFLFFKYCRAFPNSAKRLLQKGAKAQLPPSVPLKPHFDPSYNPWEQRLCVCPSGDFYKALSKGKASIVTAHIDHITEKSIILKETDQVLHPDILITATGLKIQMAGGAQISVDNNPVSVSDKHLWKGTMIEDVPNLAVTIGYTNASWTLGADATAQTVTRLLNTMEKDGKSSITPHIDDSTAQQMKDVPVLNLNSTYIVKAKGEMPKAGNMAPWLPRSTYLTDIWEAKMGSIRKGLKYL